MAGNVPNVSRNNFKYANLLTGGLSTLYDGVPLQQGVPVIDSDVNEMQDYQRMSKILDNIAIMGPGFVRFGMTSADRDGFAVLEAAAPSNNFKIGDGFAAYGGVIVPSTTDSPPAEFDYNVQILYSGTLSAVAGADLSDADKNWTAADSLAASVVAPIHGACFVVIVNSANPAEIGHAATISTSTATKLTINTVTPPTGYTVINPANLAAGDTYQIKLPLLTTNGTGVPRTDAVYLQLWFEDINETEDPDILNVAVPVEAVHKIAKRWAVRVSEGSTVPANSSSDVYGFGVRYAGFATLSRPNATPNILTAQITNTYECFTGLTSMNPKGIRFDDTDMIAAGYPNLPANQENVQDAIDSLIQTLLASTSGKGSTLVGSQGVAGTGVASLSAGTLLSQLAAIVGHLEDRIEAVNPNGTITAPIPIFRSHGLSLVSTNVTANTITVYLLPDTDGNAVNSIGLCVGCYLATDQAYSGLSTGPLATMITISSSGVYVAHANVSPGENWDYSDLNSWDYFEKFLGASSEFSNLLYANDGIDLTGILSLEDSNSYILKSVLSSSDPSRVFHNDQGTKPTIWVIGESTWITSNVTWNSGSDRWVPVNTNYHAAAVEINMTSIYVHKTNYHKANYNIGWALDAWDSKFSFAERATDLSATSIRNYIVPNVSGEVFERVHFSHRMFVPVTASQGYIFRLPINYRARRKSEPATKAVDFTLLDTNIASVTYTHVDAWGGYVTVVSNIASYTAGDVIEVRGFVEFY